MNEQKEVSVINNDRVLIVEREYLGKYSAEEAIRRIVKTKIEMERNKWCS